MFNSRNAHPVVSSKALEDAGIEIAAPFVTKLAGTKSQLDEIRQEAWEINQQELKNAKKLAHDMRQRVRRDFLGKWLGYLFHFVFSIVGFGLLYQFFIIILRLNVPGKSTYHTYFATNVTSKILRWIAWLITVAGLLLIIVEFFATMITGDVFLGVGVGLFLSFLLPLGIAAGTVVASWLFLLQSEFICFISNVYHVLFIKTYGEE